jgi:hypothetical protein
MYIYQIASAKEASEWMRGFDMKALAPKCQINKYPLGDEAYQLECPLNSWDTIKANNSIFFRSGKYLVEVSGGITETVERFARYASAQFPASDNSLDRSGGSVYFK